VVRCGADGTAVVVVDDDEEIGKVGLAIGGALRPDLRVGARMSGHPHPVMTARPGKDRHCLVSIACSFPAT